MSTGDLQRDVAAFFGSLFERCGFHETYYTYDRKHFGNEILEMTREDGTRLQFTRDRSQVFLYVAARDRPRVLVDDLLQLLGFPEVSYGDANGMPKDGLPEELKAQVNQSFDAVLSLLSEPDIYGRVETIQRERFNRWFSGSAGGRTSASPR
ncbi:MAG TPA: hypothetical protein VLV55_08490 [Rhizomicrobium sp.]|nr:hypothetical protein [Rhizomicrobium sp.]